MSDYAYAVQWADQDAFQHVNNCEFARFAQEARIHFFSTFAKVEAGPIRPVIASLKLDFKRPLFFPDHLTVRTRITRVGVTSLTLHQEMVSRAQDAIVCEAVSVLVFVEFPAMKPAPVPEIFR